MEDTRRRQPAWVLRAIIGVAGLLALLVWFILAGQPDGASPGPAATPAVGTAGGGTERVPGSPSGRTAEGDELFFPMADRAAPNQAVAFLDRQPLFAAEHEPLVNMADSEMILEERANEEGDAPKYGLYVPSAQAADKTSARFYYLKVANGRYLKVSLIKESPK
jgi:hypothetical protein